MPDPPYDPQRYWSELHRRADMSTVGQSGYSDEWNQWLYRAWLETGRRFLRRHKVTAGSVVDVGAGRGTWFPVWREVGAKHITAIDLVEVAADRSIVGDLGDPLEVGSFDLVAAMYVLLHITDDARFRVACDNLARMVKPGGWLLVAEPMLLHGKERPYRGESSRSRSLDRYRFDGLSRVAVEPATVIGGDAIEGPRLPWAMTARIGSRAPSVVGPIVARIDPWLVRRFGPSSKLALYRR